jgi:hypothetical protein
MRCAGVNRCKNFSPVLNVRKVYPVATNSAHRLTPGIVYLLHVHRYFVILDESTERLCVQRTKTAG